MTWISLNNLSDFMQILDSEGAQPFLSFQSAAEASDGGLQGDCGSGLAIHHVSIVERCQAPVTHLPSA